MSESKMPVAFIPHGGGPMPLMGLDQDRSLVEFLQGFSTLVPIPSAILVISAHWEEEVATVLSAAKPDLYFDYYNFPPETYQYTYPVAGAPELAEQISTLLNDADIENRLEQKRGLDHGVFVPLKLIYPKASIPCLQLSLLKNLDPSQHMEIGEALSNLREQGVLILGSGFSFHNLDLLKTGINSDALERSIEFDTWLKNICANPRLTKEERVAGLTHWAQAPQGRFSHPREEHLIPLHVCMGAANYKPADVIYDQVLMGIKNSAFLWRDDLAEELI